MQKTEKLGLPQSQEEPSCLIYNYCLRILISLIQEQTVNMLQGHQDDKNLTSFFEEAE